MMSQLLVLLFIRHADIVTTKQVHIKKSAKRAS